MNPTTEVMITEAKNRIMTQTGHVIEELSPLDFTSSSMVIRIITEIGDFYFRVMGDGRRLEVEDPTTGEIVEVIIPNHRIRVGDGVVTNRFTTPTVLRIHTMCIFIP